MDKLELKDKMSFIYDLISELCSDKEILRNGGISKNDFISFLEKKLSDSESKQGIHTIYNVFTDSKDDTLPMTNFCRTAREIGDMEKEEELKELLKEAEMTGKELTFEEFHDIMKKDEKDKVKKDEKKYQKHNINRFAKKNIWKKEEKEELEPSEERYSYRSKKNDNINPNKNNEEFEPKNSYSYRRVKVEQTKTVISPKVDEKNEEQPEEKKITVEEIIQEKKVEAPNNNVRHKYKFKNRFRKEPKEEDIKEKENTEENNEENNINNNENSESKRYHRRYRPNNINIDTKNENNNTVTYSRYRRKVEN